jgi:hypothetical protein
MGRGSIFDRRLNRRQFIVTAGVTAGAAALTLANTTCDPAIVRRYEQSKTATPPVHRAWVWQFSADGEPGAIAPALAAHHMGVMVKTHDGLDWMSTYDRSPSAVSGPQAVSWLAWIFEAQGVPFHAWCVVTGVNPVAEAQMAASVLAAGARSLTLDLEGAAGFWAGSPADAVTYGETLRQITPFGRVDISIDARPWRINLVPMNEFVAFTDGIAPQLYWDTFNTPDNLSGYAGSGYPPGSDGISPEFLVRTTSELLAPYNRWVIPAGQGGAADPSTWPRFDYTAFGAQMPQISVWRYGVTPPAVFSFLAAHPAGSQPPVPPATPTPATSATPTGTARPTITPSITPRPTRTPSRTPTPPPTFTPTRTPTRTPTPPPAPSSTPTQ